MGIRSLPRQRLSADFTDSADKNFLSGSIRRSICAICVICGCLLSGCISTGIHARLPRDVSMARAIRGGDPAALTTYLQESQSAERYKAVGNAVVDAIGSICTAISPFSAISAVSAHWARVVQAAIDADKFDWDLIETDRITKIEAHLAYDTQDRPQFHVTMELAPPPPPEEK